MNNKWQAPACRGGLLFAFWGTGERILKRKPEGKYSYFVHNFVIFSCISIGLCYHII